MKYDEEAFNTAIQTVGNIKDSVNTAKEALNNILSKVESDWKSKSSEKFVENVKNSITLFQTYITEIEKVNTYLNDSLKLYTETKNAASKDVGANLGNGGA
jgi:WXG100 family type VII secretion target